MSIDDSDSFYDEIRDVVESYNRLIVTAEESDETVRRLQKANELQREIFVMCIPVGLILYLYGILHGMYTCS